MQPLTKKARVPLIRIFLWAAYGLPPFPETQTLSPKPYKLQTLNCQSTRASPPLLCPGFDQDGTLAPTLQDRVKVWARSSQKDLQNRVAAIYIGVAVWGRCSLSLKDGALFWTYILPWGMWVGSKKQLKQKTRTQASNKFSQAPELLEA